MDPVALQVLHHVLSARQRGEAERVDLPGMDLNGAQLLRADLVEADLSGAGLEHAALAGAKLGRARLAGTLLTGADLSGADLTGADLRGADLTEARIEGATLADVDLRGACLEGVIGEPSTLAGARIDRAMCTRSGLSNADILTLWRSGARIEDLDDFDDEVRDGCREDSEAARREGPSMRELSYVEVEAHRLRVDEDVHLAPSARISQNLLTISTAPSEPPPAPMSLRSNRLVAPVLTPEMQQAAPWKQGDTVLGVTLASKLGRGNVATVWRGTDAEGGSMAVKIFDPERAGAGLSLPTFRRGVAVMSRLTARDAELPAGIARLLATSDNRLAFVTPLADNGSATDLPALGWGVKSAVTFFLQLCRAVDAAHREGALHRCIKPSNVLLDDDLEPILVDFDMVDLPSLAESRRDAGGYAPYAAPEELVGATTQSPTADVFSLGRMLFFVLVGSDPDEPLEDMPALAALRGQPEGLVRIIRKCTMRAPEARYQGVRELIADVERYEDHEAVGVAGEGADASYLPYRVSSLPHNTRWIGSDRPSPPRRSSRPPGPLPPRSRSVQPPGPRRRPGRPAPPAPPSESSAKVLGTVGAFVVLGSLLAAQLMTDHSPESLLALRGVGAVGAGGMTLLIARRASQPTLWRLVLFSLAATLVYLLNLPQLFVR